MKNLYLSKILTGLYFFRRYPVLPVMIVILLILCSLFAEFLAQHDPLVGRLEEQDRPPVWQDSPSIISGKYSSPEYILGTDAWEEIFLAELFWVLDIP